MVEGDSEKDRRRTLTGMTPAVQPVTSTITPLAEEPIELDDEVADSGTGEDSSAAGYRHAETSHDLRKDGGIAEAVKDTLDYKKMYETAEEGRINAEKRTKDAESAIQLAEKRAEESKRMYEDAESARQQVATQSGGIITQLAGQVERLTAQNEVLGVTNQGIRRKLSRVLGETKEASPQGGDELATAIERVAELARKNATLEIRTEMYRIRVEDSQAYSQFLDAHSALEGKVLGLDARIRELTTEVEERDVILQMRDKRIKALEEEPARESSDTLVGIAVPKLPETLTPQMIADAAYENALVLLREGHSPVDQKTETIRKLLSEKGLSNEKILEILMAKIDYRIALKELYTSAEKTCKNADANMKALQERVAELSGLEKRAQEITTAEQMMAQKGTELAELLASVEKREAQAEGITAGFADRQKEFASREAAQADALRTLDRKIRGGLQQTVGRLSAVYRNITSVMGICSRRFLDYRGRARSIVTNLRELSQENAGVSLIFTKKYTGLLIPEPESGAIYADVPPGQHGSINDIVSRAEERKVANQCFESGSHQDAGHYVIVPAEENGTYIAHLCVTGLKTDETGMIPKPVRDQIKKIATAVVNDIHEEYATLYAINPEGGLKDIGIRLETLQKEVIKGTK